MSCTPSPTGAGSTARRWPLEARLQQLSGELEGTERFDRLSALLDDIDAHEREETQVLQEALLRDTGTGD